MAGIAVNTSKGKNPAKEKTPAKANVPVKANIPSTRQKVLKRELELAYVISDDCICCGACESECPTSAISEGDVIYVIDADLCLECGICESVCPVDAIAKA